MNEELDSQLSAMFDDELASAECELLARRLSRDEQLKARWERYAVIAAAIRAEPGVRLNVRVARRVSAVLGSEPALGVPATQPRRELRWWRPVAGAAMAAGVAAVSILWLRAQAPLGAAVATPPLSAVPASRATAPMTASTTPATVAARTPSGPDSYVVPPRARPPAAIVPATELANYVVAHSRFSAPVARGTLLSSFMTSESAAAGSGAVFVESALDRPRDAQGNAQ
jgi:negative regulator of sigma E activity